MAVVTDRHDSSPVLENYVLMSTVQNIDMMSPYTPLHT